MAAAKKKTPAKKQPAPAAKKVTKQTAPKKTVKTRVQVKAKAKVKAVKTAVKKQNAASAKKAKVQIKTKPKTVKAPAKAVAKKKVPAAKKVTKQTASKKTVKTRAQVKAKAAARKAVAVPAKRKTVPQKRVVAQKPVKKALAAVKTAAPKKAKAAVAPAAERFRGLKSMLIAKRDTLLKEAKQEIQKYVSGENRQLVDTAIDEADWAAVEISEDINLKRLSAQRQLLNDVEECLRKLNEGTYGTCEDCGEEISEKRLHVIPTATLCIDCKEQREKMAILDQDTEI